MSSVIAKLVNFFKKQKVITNFDFQIENSQICNLKFNNINIFLKIHFQISLLINNSFQVINPTWKIIKNNNKLFLMFQSKNNKTIIKGSIIFSFNKATLIIEKRINSNIATQVQLFTFLDLANSDLLLNQENNELTNSQYSFKIESTEFWKLEDKQLVFTPLALNPNLQSNNPNSLVVKSNNRAYFTNKLTFRSNDEKE